MPLALATLTKEKLESLYASYGSIRELAKAIGTNPKSLAREMRKHDIAYDRSARKYSIHHDFFAQDTEATFYWAGFIAANGHVVNDKGYRIELNIAVQDKAHLESMVAAMGSNTPVKEQVSKTKEFVNHYVRTVVSSKYLVADLEDRFSITPRKKFSYAMPDWLMIHDNIRHFIRGWVDGIGGFTYSHQQVTFRTRGTHLMIKQLSLILCNELSVDMNDIIIKPVEPPLEMLFISNKQVLEKLFHYLYKDASVFLRRKKNEGLHLEIG